MDKKRLLERVKSVESPRGSMSVSVRVSVRISETVASALLSNIRTFTLTWRATEGETPLAFSKSVSLT